MSNISKYVVWYPCYKSIIKGFVNGSIKNRLEMESEKTVPLCIFANGPSVLETIKYWEKSSGQMDTMMLNDAYSTELFRKIRPAYYCFADPIDLRPWEEATSYINVLCKYDPEVITIVPSWFNSNIGYWKKIRTKKVFISDAPIDIKQYDFKLLRKNYMSPQIWNVSIMALYAGIQLGYKTIYLHGYDMTLYDNVKVNQDNEVIIVNDHFYDGDSGETYLHRSMEYLYDAISNNYTSFNILAKYAEHCGVKIINMSGSSKLDMFERYKE